MNLDQLIREVAERCGFSDLRQDPAGSYRLDFAGDLTVSVLRNGVDSLWLAGEVLDLAEVRDGRAQLLQACLKRMAAFALRESTAIALDPEGSKLILVQRVHDEAQIPDRFADQLADFLNRMEIWREDLAGTAPGLGLGPAVMDRGFAAGPTAMAFLDPNETV